MWEAGKPLFYDDLIVRRKDGQEIVFMRKMRIILPLALSVYLFTIPSRYLSQSRILSNSLLFTIVFLLISLGIGCLGYKRWNSRNFSRYFIYLFLAALAVITAFRLMLAIFTTQSMYFPISALVTILMLAGHYCRNKTLYFLVLAVWVISMWCLQMSRIEAKEIHALIVYLGLLVWLATEWFAGEQKKPPLFFKGAMAFVLIALPIQEGKYLHMSDREQKRIFSQPGVEAIFIGNDDEKIPFSRMEMKCDLASGNQIVSPHAISNNMSIVDHGAVTNLALGGESPDQSTFIGPFWLTTSKGNFLLVDVERKEIKRRVAAPLGDVYYLNYNPEWNLLVVSQRNREMFGTRECLFFNADEQGNIHHISDRYVKGEQCIAIDKKTILISRYNQKDIIALYDLETNTILKKMPRLPIKEYYIPFHQFAVDYRHRVFYAAIMYPGVIVVRNMDTLEYISQFKTNPGVRNVLVDNKDPRHIYSWNYATGEVIEHRIPGGEKVRSWTLGPLLRTLNWDCNDKDLLATTVLGGFRIHLD